jgi:Alpha-N-acetylglucosaminidase (NAGLU) C-terminal domain
LERFNPVSRAGELISMIDDLDHALSTNKAFSFSSWLDAARAWANATATTFATL